MQTILYGNELSYVYYFEDGEVIPGDMSYEYVEINGKYFVAKETEESNIEGERYIAENTYSYDEYGNEIGCKVYYSFCETEESEPDISVCTYRYY